MAASPNTAEVALREDAQTRAEDIRSRLESLAININEIPALIETAYRERDWEALGYPDWETYVREQFGTQLLKLSKGVRRQWTQDLRAVGLTTRQIAPVTNVSKATAARDAVSSEASQDNEPAGGIIDGEVISDPAETSKQLADLVKVIDRVHLGISFLDGTVSMPEDLTPEQARAWHDLIAGKRGKGRAGLVKQLREFADKLSAAAGPK